MAGGCIQSLDWTPKIESSALQYTSILGLTGVIA